VSAVGELAVLADHPDVIGIGVDLVQVARMRAVMDRTPRLVERVLAVDERTYCEAQAAPEQHVAARFAAKEAVVKVLGTGLFSVALADIEVVRGSNGEPSMELGGSAAAMAERLGIGRWMVSLTHTDEVAGAFVVALGSRERS